MKTVIQNVVLRNDRHWGARSPAYAVGQVIRLIPQAIQYSIRMAFEGRSTVQGVHRQLCDLRRDCG